ncbi:MAG: FHA domain-containing protein [Myxococcales bacterium]|nr:FHA domain-containing protein [Myxococcales bacterium]
MAMPDLIISVRRPPGAAEVRRVREAEVLLGRAAHCALRLADDGVSAEHLRLLRRDAGWVMVDAGSTHGTWRGDERLPAGTAVPLRDGEVLRIGPFVVEVFVDAEAGLTTNSRDTESIVRELAAAQGVQIVDAAPAGAAAPPRWTPLEVAALAAAAAGAGAALWALLG